MPDDLAARARKRAEDFREARYMNDAGRIFLCEASQSDADLLTAIADRVDEQERRIKELEVFKQETWTAIAMLSTTHPEMSEALKSLINEVTALSQKGGE